MNCSSENETIGSEVRELNERAIFSPAKRSKRRRACCSHDAMDNRQACSCDARAASQGLSKNDPIQDRVRFPWLYARRRLRVLCGASLMPVRRVVGSPGALSTRSKASTQERAHLQRFVQCRRVVMTHWEVHLERRALPSTVIPRTFKTGGRGTHGGSLHITELREAPSRRSRH